MSKICCKCKTEQSLDQFRLLKNKVNKYYSYCKPCTKQVTALWRDSNKEYAKAYDKAYRAGNRDKIKSKREQNKDYYKLYKQIHKERIRQQNYENRIKKAYNLTPKDVEDLRLSQKNACSICNTSFNIKRMNIDHCHATGVIRGLLCNPCNAALGLFDDDIHNLKAAIKYLTKTDSTDVERFNEIY